MKISYHSFEYNGFEAKLVCYTLGEEHLIQGKESPSVPPRPFLLVVPGGGYHMVCEREAEPIAVNFLNRGFNAAVLYYSVDTAKFPTQLVELSFAVNYIRKNAKELNADPEKLFVYGASAGGHLAASLGVFYDEAFLKKETGLSAKEIMPNGLILSYPVITSGEKAHRNSFHYLLQDDEFNKELLELVSLEKHVSEKVPPTFICTTMTDSLVPAENSLMFAGELLSKGVKCELHVYPTGEHGSSLCTSETIMTGDVSEYEYMKGWVDDAERFLRSL